jgi:large subunit ribosomal protein L29
MATTKEKRERVTVNDLRKLEAKDLLARVAELKQSLFDLRNKHSTGVLDSTADLGKTRREIARILMVAREQEVATAAAGKAAASAAQKAAAPAAQKARE